MNAPGDTPPAYGPQWPRIGAVVAAALLAGFLVWLLVIRDDDDDDGSRRSNPAVVATEVRPYGPALASAGELRAAAGQVGHDVYWAGEDYAGDVELTLSGDGRAFVRYLTGNSEPGVEESKFLTIATYEIEDAAGVLEEVAGREGRESFEPARGGLAVFSDAEPERVYFTPQGSDLQVEVFHPDVGEARELVESGEIEPIG